MNCGLKSCLIRQTNTNDTMLDQCSAQQTSVVRNDIDRRK